MGEQHCVDDGGRSKDGCCCGNMSKQLGTVEKLVLQLTNIVNRLSRSSSSLVNSRRTIECHRTFVTKSIGECPKDSVQQVVDLNSSLRDPKLAISMVMPLCLLLYLFLKNIYLVYLLNIGFCYQSSLQIC